MTPQVVKAERRRMRRKGFLGRAGRILSHERSGAHYIRVVSYLFGQDHASPFVEVWETHDRARRAKIVPLSELVHLVQNVGEDEFWNISARRKPRK